jgi:molybdopterin converting factor subunit 1
MDREAAPGDLIRVRSLFFASYRDLLGTAEADVELPVGASVRDLVQIIRDRPGGNAIPASPAVAVNQEYCRPDRLLSDGDEVAFIPPVAGG